MCCVASESHNLSAAGRRYINILSYRLVNCSRNQFIRCLVASTFPVVTSLPLFRLDRGWCLLKGIFIPCLIVLSPISLLYVLVVLFLLSSPSVRLISSVFCWSQYPSPSANLVYPWIGIFLPCPLISPLHQKLYFGVVF
jgi:hypothetical protein